jgi:AcrR family transcriptional regulator
MAVTVVDGRVVRGERNRQAIADALLACYEDGLLRPSIPEVAARAGVSVRSVHNHFDDIESLRADGVRRQWERFAKLPEPEGPAELIEQRARMYERITPVRRAALLSVHESPTISRNLARFDRILRRQVERVFSVSIARSARHIGPAPVVGRLEPPALRAGMQRRARQARPHRNNLHAHGRERTAMTRCNL